MKALCLTTLLCQAGLVFAELHGTITGTTNYVSRMYSKSNGDPAIQGNIDYQHASGFYAGASVSSFNLGRSEVNEDKKFNNQARAEIVPYLGWTFKPADNWRMDVQYSRYFYDGKIFEYLGDYNEFYVFLHYKDLVSAQVSFIDDFYGMGKISYNYEITGRYPVTDFLEFSSTFGYAKTEHVLFADYPYWNVGFTARYKFLAFDLRYHDASEIYFTTQKSAPDHPETLQSTLVFTISAGF